MPNKIAANWPVIAAEAERRIRKEQFLELAAKLKVSVESLKRLHLGRWTDDWLYWCFPMRNNGCITGIRTRSPDGGKWSMEGSHPGLFVPDGLPEGGPLWVAEGESDTAAMLSIGLNVVGRPGCRLGAEALAPLRERWSLMVLADNSPDEIAGAKWLAKSLVLPMFKPPDQWKDAREWITAGANAASFTELKVLAP